MNTDTFRLIIDELVEAGMKRKSAERFSAHLHYRSYRAKSLVFSQGDKPTNLVFILSGYIRLFVADESGDISIRLIGGPGDFVACIVSAMYGMPADYTAECITDCQLVVIDPYMQSEIRKESRFRLLMQDIILRRLIDMVDEKAAMLPLKATDRYLYFMERHPQFVKHIPAATIANYIGVRPQSLSRIRQGLR